MADNAKLDSQFIIDSNKSQHKSTQDELAYKLHRSVRSNRHKLDQIESIKSSSDLRNELKSLYTSIYNDDTQFSERTSQLFHTSIQKIGSEPNNPDLNPFPKPKRRQRRKPKSDDRFTSLWNKSILNKKIKVYWPLDKKYYRGIVSSINENKSKPILITYNDGDKEWLNLKNETFEFYDSDNNINNSATPPPKTFFNHNNNKYVVGQKVLARDPKYPDTVIFYAGIVKEIGDNEIKIGYDLWPGIENDRWVKQCLYSTYINQDSIVKTCTVK
eukprot:7330_1